MKSILFTVLCSIAAFGIYLIMGIMGLIQYSNITGGIVAVIGLLAFIILSRFINITKWVLLFPLLIIVITIIIIAISTSINSSINNPTNSLPEAARYTLEFTMGRCNQSYGACQVWSVQKAPNKYNYGTGEAWCIQIKVTPNNEASYYAYNLIYESEDGFWTVISADSFPHKPLRKSIELGCTNYENE